MVYFPTSIVGLPELGCRFVIWRCGEIFKLSQHVLPAEQQSALCYLRSQNLHPGRFEAKVPVFVYPFDCHAHHLIVVQNWEIFLNEENAFVLGLDAGISSDPEATEATDVRNRTDVAEDGWRRLLFCLCEQVDRVSLRV